MTKIAERFLGTVVLHRAVEMALGQDSRAYPAPHCGRPGDVGGSRPREECVAGVEKPALFVFDEYYGKSTLPDELLDEVSGWGGDRAWAGEKAVTSGIAYSDVFVLRHREEFVGVAMVSQYTTTVYLNAQLPGPTLLLRWIATKRTGPNAYGTRLMLRVVQHAIERGYGLCGTSTDEALPFYEALGAKVVETDTGVNNIIFVSLAKLKRLVGGQRSALTLDKAADIDWAAWAKLEPADGVFATTSEEEEKAEEGGETQRGGPGSGHHGHKGRPGQVGGSLPRKEGIATQSEKQAERFARTMRWDEDDTNGEFATQEINRYMEVIPDDVVAASSLKQLIVCENPEDIRTWLQRVAPHEDALLKEDDVLRGFFDRETHLAAVSLWNSFDMEYSGRNFFHEYGHSLETWIISDLWEQAWGEWEGTQDEAFADAFAEWMVGRLANDGEIPLWFSKYRPFSHALFECMGLGY